MVQEISSSQKTFRKVVFNPTYALSLNASIDIGYLVLIDTKHSLLLSAFVVDFHNVELFVLHKVHVADRLARHQVSRQIGSILH